MISHRSLPRQAAGTQAHGTRSCNHGSLFQALTQSFRV